MTIYFTSIIIHIKKCSHRVKLLRCDGKFGAWLFFKEFAFVYRLHHSIFGDY